MDSAATSLGGFGISRSELAVLAEAKVRENAPSLRKALFDDER